MRRPPGDDEYDRRADDHTHPNERLGHSISLLP